MPPKPKFTREEIVSAAIDIIRADGGNDISAREIGKRINASSSPIFTVFKNMDDLKAEILRTLLDDYNSKSRYFDQKMPLFRQYGEQMVNYAIEEPNLFKYVFLQQPDRKINASIKKQAEKLPLECYEILKEKYSLSEEQAKKIFNEVWIYTFGLATLCALGAAKPTPDETRELLSNMFLSLIARVKPKQ